MKMCEFKDPNYNRIWYDSWDKVCSSKCQLMKIFLSPKGLKFKKKLYSISMS